MLAFLDRPLPIAAFAAAAAAMLLAGAVYCSAYNMLQGSWEDPSVGAIWSLTNLLPWLFAFEAAKRAAAWPLGAAGRWLATAALLGAVAAASVLLEAAIGSISLDRPLADLSFQMLRRVPAAMLVVTLVLARRLLRPTGAAVARLARDGSPEAPAELPLLPAQIDWVKAAGNYLEFRSGAGMVLRRMTMAQAERRLNGHGFVRVHRSALVNPARIARVRKGKAADEIELTDGTRLRVGGAYRTFVDRLG